MSHWTSRLHRAVGSVTSMTLTKTPFQKHSLKLLTVPQPPNVLNVQSAVGAPSPLPNPLPLIPRSPLYPPPGLLVVQLLMRQSSSVKTPCHAMPCPCHVRRGRGPGSWRGACSLPLLMEGSVLKSSRSLRPCKHLRERRWEALQLAL